MIERNINILLSFVGTNDRGNPITGDDGAILTVFKQRDFDEVHLLWNESQLIGIDFHGIAKYVRETIQNRGYCSKVFLHEFKCADVTDHNAIYPELLKFCRTIEASKESQFTAAIASGTPAMQACWIMLAESGDFPVALIRSNEARYGKPLVTTVKLGTGLPRIVSLEKENAELKKLNVELLHRLVLDIDQGQTMIGDIVIFLSPMEFSYYRYFAERVIRGLGFERISGITAPRHFLVKIIEYHKESFPDSELLRVELEKLLKHKQDLDVRTFRANVSKLNTKIRLALGKSAWSDIFIIASEGKRHAKHYGLKTPSEKILLKRT